MNTTLRRVALIAVSLGLAFGAATAKAPAGLDMADGAQQVVKDQPIAACNAAARTALQAVFSMAQEIGTGTGEWVAYGTPDTANGSTTAGAIHCYPLDPGYLVTFTCAAQVPPSTDSASALCTKLATAFNSKPTAVVTP